MAPQFPALTPDVQKKRCEIGSARRGFGGPLTDGGRLHKAQTSGYLRVDPPDYVNPTGPFSPPFAAQTEPEV